MKNKVKLQLCRERERETEIETEQDRKTMCKWKCWYTRFRVTFLSISARNLILDYECKTSGSSPYPATKILYTLGKNYFISLSFCFLCGDRKWIPQVIFKVFSTSKIVWKYYLFHETHCRCWMLGKLLYHLVLAWAFDIVQGKAI